MRYRLIALFSAVLCILVLTNPPVTAQDAKTDVKGVFLLTDYPAVSVRPGTTANVGMRLHNFGQAPERLELSVSGVPEGWTATLLGGGQPVAAAMPSTNSSVSIELRLDVPKDAKMEAVNLTVTAKGTATTVTLPIAVNLAKELPAKLTLQPQLPELRGTSRATFEFQLAIKNDSGKKLLVSLAAQAPPNFEVSFTEVYGSQELNAIPIDPGQSKDVKLKVRPPNTIGAGKFQITARVAAEDATASTELGIDITGQPKLDVTGRQGLVSARASAGIEATVPIIVVNSGTAPAEQVELTGTAPSGWKVAFEPKTIDRLAPNETKEVQALITPTAKAIAGDYVTAVRVAARGETATANFRITVTTSTMWGIIGAALIGIALLVLVGAVARFGRR